MRPFGPWMHMETLFVRVDTDAGITGWGEAFGFAASALTREAVRAVVAPLCEGREFIDVPAFMADLQRKLHAMGRHGPVSFALAGIDIALWDIAGKAQGVPIHRLLGGATRDRVPTYASLLRYGKPDLSPATPRRRSGAATHRSSCTNIWSRPSPGPRSRRSRHRAYGRHQLRLAAGRSHRNGAQAQGL